MEKSPSRHTSRGHLVSVEVPSGVAHRQNLHRDSRLEQTAHERAVLSKDDVKVDLLECGQEPEQRKLAAGEPRTMVEEHDAWPRSLDRPNRSLVDLLVPLHDRVPRE